jgi:hypothetical protein
MSEPTFKLELTAPEMDAVMIALQSCVNVPFSAGYLMNLVSKINAQGQPQLQALAVQKDAPEEPIKAGGTD